MLFKYKKPQTAFLSAASLSLYVFTITHLFRLVNTFFEIFLFLFQNVGCYVVFKERDFKLGVRERVGSKKHYIFQMSIIRAFDAHIRFRGSQRVVVVNDNKFPVAGFVNIAFYSETASVSRSNERCCGVFGLNAAQTSVGNHFRCCFIYTYCVKYLRFPPF